VQGIFSKKRIPNVIILRVTQVQDAEKQKHEQLTKD
jgi:hypothetical protein